MQLTTTYIHTYTHIHAYKCYVFAVLVCVLHVTVVSETTFTLARYRMNKSSSTELSLLLDHTRSSYCRPVNMHSIAL